MDSHKIKLAIKQVMKNKGFTYHNLADHLEVSHATVKRILTSEEMGLSRLFQICEFLNLALSELVTFAANQVEEREVSFTNEQELFLAGDPRYYLYLSSLYSGQTPQQIAKKYNLDLPSQDKYVRRLEQHELVRVTSKGVVKPTHVHMPNWRRSGPMAEFHVMGLIKSFSHFFIERIPEDLKEADNEAHKRKTSATIYCSPMSKENYQLYVDELHQVQRKWEDVANLEEKTKGEDHLGRHVVLNLCGWVEEEKELGELENVLGQIENL
jgi:DNA-binding Xre family transcriptional regulator